MQGVANLHGQMGQLAAQLREAHADAEGAQQQLQQERQEAATRTTALHEALGQLHTQLDELRGDHEDLQEAHRALVAKDLMRSGLLKDRYVADLFTRLKEAEWKLQTARKRASTWGFDMMVPLGRTDRGIQTQYAEAAADSAALTAHAVPSGLWNFVISQVALQQHQGTKEVHTSPSRKGAISVTGAQEAAALLAQLLGSLQLHASSVKEVALFEWALQDSRNADGVAISSAVSSPRGSGVAAARASSVGTSGVFKPSWGDVALDTGKLRPSVQLSRAVLLPPGAEELLQQVLTWPGMLALLQWVAEGHFLAGLKEGDLGKLLMDVQAPHIHFLLLETADILSLHPLPKIQTPQETGRMGWGPGLKAIELKAMGFENVAMDVCWVNGDWPNIIDWSCGRSHCFW
eukprot:gene2908-3196_t